MLLLGFFRMVNRLERIGFTSPVPYWWTVYGGTVGLLNALERSRKMSGVQENVIIQKSNIGDGPQQQSPQQQSPQQQQNIENVHTQVINELCTKYDCSPDNFMVLLHYLDACGQFDITFRQVLGIPSQSDIPSEHASLIRRFHRMSMKEPALLQRFATTVRKFEDGSTCPVCLEDIDELPRVVSCHGHGCATWLCYDCAVSMMGDFHGQCSVCKAIPEESLWNELKTQYNVTEQGQQQPCVDEYSVLRNFVASNPGQRYYTEAQWFQFYQEPVPEVPQNDEQNQVEEMVDEEMPYEVQSSDEELSTDEDQSSDEEVPDDVQSSDEELNEAMQSLSIAHTGEQVELTTGQAAERVSEASMTQQDTESVAENPGPAPENIRLTALRQIVDEASASMNAHLTLDELQTDFHIMMNPSYGVTIGQDIGDVRALVSHLVDICEGRRIHLAPVFNLGFLILIYAEEHDLTQNAAIEAMNVDRAATLKAYIRFAKIIREYHAYRFLYRCRTCWTSLRNSLTFLPTVLKDSIFDERSQHIES